MTRWVNSPCFDKMVRERLVLTKHVSGVPRAMSIVGVEKAQQEYIVEFEADEHTPQRWKVQIDSSASAPSHGRSGAGIIGGVALRVGGGVSRVADPRESADLAAVGAGASLARVRCRVALRLWDPIDRKSLVVPVNAICRKKSEEADRAGEAIEQYAAVVHKGWVNKLEQGQQVPCPLPSADDVFRVTSTWTRIISEVKAGKSCVVDPLAASASSSAGAASQPLELEIGADVSALRPVLWGLQPPMPISSLPSSTSSAQSQALPNTQHRAVVIFRSWLAQDVMMGFGPQELTQGQQHGQILQLSSSSSMDDAASSQPNAGVGPAQHTRAADASMMAAESVADLVSPKDTNDGYPAAAPSASSVTVSGSAAAGTSSGGGAGGAGGNLGDATWSSTGPELIQPCIADGRGIDDAGYGQGPMGVRERVAGSFMYLLVHRTILADRSNSGSGAVGAALLQSAENATRGSEAGDSDDIICPLSLPATPYDECQPDISAWRVARQYIDGSITLELFRRAIIGQIDASASDHDDSSTRNAGNVADGSSNLAGSQANDAVNGNGAEDDDDDEEIELESGTTDPPVVAAGGAGARASGQQQHQQTLEALHPTCPTPLPTGHSTRRLACPTQVFVVDIDVIARSVGSAADVEAAIAAGLVQPAPSNEADPTESSALADATAQVPSFAPSTPPYGDAAESATPPYYANPATPPYYANPATPPYFAASGADAAADGNENAAGAGTAAASANTPQTPPYFPPEESTAVQQAASLQTAAKAVTIPAVYKRYERDATARAWIARITGRLQCWLADSSMPLAHVGDAASSGTGPSHGSMLTAPLSSTTSSSPSLVSSSFWPSDQVVTNGCVLNMVRATMHREGEGAVIEQRYFRDGADITHHRPISSTAAAQTVVSCERFPAGMAWTTESQLLHLVLAQIDPFPFGLPLASSASSSAAEAAVLIPQVPLQHLRLHPEAAAALRPYAGLQPHSKRIGAARTSRSTSGPGLESAVHAQAATGTATVDAIPRLSDRAPVLVDASDLCEGLVRAQLGPLGSSHSSSSSSGASKVRSAWVQTETAAGWTGHLPAWPFWPGHGVAYSAPLPLASITAASLSSEHDAESWNPASDAARAPSSASGAVGGAADDDEDKPRRAPVPVNPHGSRWMPLLFPHRHGSGDSALFPAAAPSSSSSSSALAVPSHSVTLYHGTSLHMAQRIAAAGFFRAQCRARGVCADGHCDCNMLGFGCYFGDYRKAEHFALRRAVYNHERKAQIGAIVAVRVSLGAVKLATAEPCLCGCYAIDKDSGLPQRQGFVDHWGSWYAEQGYDSLYVRDNSGHAVRVREWAVVDPGRVKVVNVIEVVRKGGGE